MNNTPIQTLIRTAALGIGLIVSVAPPIGYAAMKYNDDVRLLLTIGNFSAGRIAKYIYVNNKLWQYQQVRIAELVELHSDDSAKYSQRLIDAKGKTVFDEEKTISWPTLVRRLPVIVNGEPAAHLEIASSLRSLFLTTSGIAIISALLGFFINLTVRTAPLRIIDRAFKQIEEQNEVRLNLERERNRDIAERDLRREKLETDIADFHARIAAALGEGAQARDAMSRATLLLATTATETQTGAGQVAALSQKVSTNMAGVAAATHQISSSIDGMAHYVEQAETAIHDAEKQANFASSTIGGLFGSVQEIGAITSFINKIASKTNLLALNATIEAARAGSAGRGFAVVASEVKSLALQSAEAAKNISAKIEEVRRRTTEVVDAITAINKTNNEVTTLTGTVTNAVKEQNHATQSITHNIHDAAEWTAGMSNIVEGLVSVLDQARTTVDEVRTASGASVLADDKISELVQEFLEKVKAA
jgi:methyl-accepting chemotaxis protein